MSVSKQFAFGLVVGILLTLFLVFSLQVISSVHTTNNSPSLRSSSSPDDGDAGDADGAVDYCRTMYTPDAYFHHVHRVLHMLDRSVLFLDVGGHEGVVSLPALVCTPARHRVLTIEPVSRNLDILTSTASRLGLSTPSYHWHLVRGGLSNESKDAVIYVPTERGDNAALSEAASIANVGGTAKPESIHLYKGDDVMNKHGWKPDVMKIDVQGTELFVLQGMQNMLSEDRNMILVTEYDNKLMSAHGVTAVEPFDLLVAHGFRAFCKPELVLDRESGAVYANVSASTEITRDVMTTTGPDMTVCGDITYVKYIGNGPDGK